MKRSFWSMVFVAMTVLGGWTVYVGAQEIQDLLVPVPQQDGEAQQQYRYQFVDHFFLLNGTRYEIFLRLDRTSGRTWRYHASQPSWVEIEEGPDSLPIVDGTESRFELMSHVYHDESGTEHEQFLRVDYVDGHSWKYKGMDKAWAAITVPGISEPTQVSEEPVAPEAG